MFELRFSMLQVVAAVSETQDPERFRAFQDEGCIAALDCNFFVLKSDTYCQAFCSRVAAKQGSCFWNVGRNSKIHRSRFVLQNGASTAIT